MNIPIHLPLSWVLHRGVVCKLSVRWIYHCHCSVSTWTRNVESTPLCTALAWNHTTMIFSHSKSPSVKSPSKKLLLLTKPFSSVQCHKRFSIMKLPCVLILFSVCGLFSIIFLWLLASVYITASVALADFCFDPTPWVMHIMQDKISKDISSYYLQCSNIIGTPNPFERPLTVSIS